MIKQALLCEHTVCGTSSAVSSLPTSHPPPAVRHHRVCFAGVPKVLQRGLHGRAAGVCAEGNNTGLWPLMESGVIKLQA